MQDSFLLKKIYVIGLFLLYPVIILAKEYKYPVSSIPDNLKKNAKAVVRKHDMHFKVKSASNAELTVYCAITILNENGIDDSYFVEMYNKFMKISNIKVTIYNAKGEKVKRIPADDIQDYSAISGFSIYEDTRVKFIDPEHRTIPFTVEYSFKNTYKGLLFFPDWILYEDYNISTERSSFTVTVPSDYNFRYFERNLTTKPIITRESDKTIYNWDTTNLEALVYEPYSVPYQDYIPELLTAPSDFVMEGFPGNCNSWLAFGNWINKLNQDRDILPEETLNEVRELVKDAEDNFEKVKILYEFLQNKTRYVSIQVGIGGWQPFEAAIVDKYSYGDCKALTNYMYTILKAAGVPSNYVLVNAGRSAECLVKDFPSSQFNHAILMVPDGNDTIWLECTNQQSPCGYIGTFTDDRDVLVIDDKGGHIVHTKVYTEKENIKTNIVNVTLDAEGNGTADVHTKYKGVFYDNIRRILSSDDKDKEKLIYKNIKIPNYTINSFTHDVQKSRIPIVDEKVDVAIASYGTIMGDIMITNLNLINKIVSIPKKVENRVSDVYIRRSYINMDTITFAIPDNYIVKQLPGPVTIETPFGIYKASASSHNNEVTYTRYLLMKKGKFPKEKYVDLRKFFEEIIVADDMKMILKKQ